MSAKEIELIETGVFGPDVPLSAAAKVGDLVYVSGNLGNRHGTLELVEGGIAAETRQALTHMQETLEAAGSALDRVLKVNIYIVDMAEFAALNEAYLEVFAEHRPARATVAVKELALGARVEIECVAAAR